MKLLKCTYIEESYVYLGVDRVTNAKVLQRMSKSKELLDTMKERKVQNLGHVMRGEKYEVLRIVLEGKIKGKRLIGRRQNSWLKDIRRWLGKTSNEIFKAAVNRTLKIIWIANLRRETASSSEEELIVAEY